MSTSCGNERGEALTPERVVEEMARIAFASWTDFARVVETTGENGEIRQEIRLIPTARVPKAKRGALAGIKQSSSGVEVKLCDKWRALEALAKLLGLPQGGGEAEGEAMTIVDDI